MTDRPAVADDVDPQRRANDRLWARRGLVGIYANRVLRPAEVMLLVRYRTQLAGRALEIGCGGGRLTGYLVEIASAVHAIDVSPEMIDYCRRAYPQATFSLEDVRNVATFGAGSFDVVVAGNNVLDVLDDAERNAVLESIHQVLTAGGLLIMSSHNRAFVPRLDRPLEIRNRRLIDAARDLARWPSWRRNRRRLLPYERTEPDYSILNDKSHDFMALHYYIARNAQERQLAAHGFELLECRDQADRLVASGETAAADPELHYVARRPPDPADLTSPRATA
jgi:SAM-dependent methyltransferase